MSISWASARALSPADAIEVLRREHMPYVPELVEVNDDVGIGWRPPTEQERLESLLEEWCDGCNRAADRCTVATVLQLVDVRPWWRRLLRSRPAGPYPSSALPSDGA